MPKSLDIETVTKLDQLPGLSVDTQFRALCEVGLIKLEAGINASVAQPSEMNFRVVCLEPVQNRKSTCESISVTQKGWDLAIGTSVGHILNPVTKAHSVGIKVFKELELPLV